MIIYCSGKDDILQSNTDIIVNPVNTVGVMGAGLARQFKFKYPKNFNAYRQCCISGKLSPGNIFIYVESGKIIFNVATKQHWGNPSEAIWIKSILKQIRQHLSGTYEDHSISLSLIGTGNGGLSRDRVKQLIVESLFDLENTVKIYN